MHVRSVRKIFKVSTSSLCHSSGWSGWALYKWKQSDELFPRIYFEVGVKFLGLHEGHHVTEVIATIENKGVVPLPG